MDVASQEGLGEFQVEVQGEVPPFLDDTEEEALDSEEVLVSEEGAEEEALEDGVDVSEVDVGGGLVLRAGSFPTFSGMQQLGPTTGIPDTHTLQATEESLATLLVL